MLNKVLLIGNGFDLAHGLKTRYGDFLKIMKEWDAFWMGYQAIKARRTINSEHLFYDCLEFASGMEESNLIRLGEIIKSNTWCHYYCKCEAEIDGWIDFEKEIYPVIELFKNIFRVECDVRKEGGDVYAIISKELFSKQQVRVANLWKKFVGVQGQIALIVNAPYVSLQYGVLKKRLLKN